ncbi:hypothetical protein C2S51_012670 [Perilla frutescens var. frutescens]|nr:hypothetical protein C2S51_012670 [Perilla frutescens var. frutescens]
MDSPESSIPNRATTNASETAPAQDSPIFSYISNLSPIQPVKAPSVTQGFPGLNSPPFVFTSPRLNVHSQPTFHKRAQFPRTSFAKLHEQFEDSKNIVTTVKGPEKLDIQLSTRGVASGEKVADSKSPVGELIQSPSGSHEQFLEDIVNADSPDPKFSFDSTIKKSEHNDQPADALTCSKESLVNCEHGLNSGINEEVTVSPPVTSRQTEEVQKENILINASAAENVTKHEDGVSVDHCPKIGSELSSDNALVDQDEDDFMTENAEAGHTAPLDQSSHLLTGSKVNGKDNENFVATSGATLIGQNDLKAFQNRGARRRCLQFGDAHHNSISNKTAQDPSDGEGEKSLSLETPLVPIDGKLYPGNTLNSSIKIPKPSGIGLHLNSIVNTVQAGSGAIINVKAAQWESVSATTDGNKRESNACVSADSATALSTHLIKPAINSVILNSKANKSNLGNKRKSTDEGSGLVVINDSSSKKKRMKTMDSGDGCKRCNCKRSKCLKLYCDCFAAGIYCAEPCACQECYNRPEYEDTVIETRQKIESRDPFAFAPRVVQHIIEQPTISSGEDGSNFTPASARHKKGCKCKKSMCLKKYCECYQANVGCSDGCRCEGCKNVYGQKGEHGMTKVIFTGEDTQETIDGSFVENCEITASGSHAYHTEFVNPHNLTPPTPAFQFSNHGKDASKAWFPSGKYFQSPESGFTHAAPYVMPPGSPRNSNNNVTIPDSSKDILDLVCFDQESHHGNADTVDEFSAVCPHSGKMGHLTDIPNLQKWADNSKAQSFSAKRNYLSGCSLVWRGSPITPMAQFSGSKVLQEVEFDSGLSNIMQDDTPEILKDTSTPLNTVKASSPNKKRVSPPHGRPHGFSSSSSAGLRNGRKFILKAVPSFPPLTPCIDSKTLDEEQDNIPENLSVNQ